MPKQGWEAVVTLLAEISGTLKEWVKSADARYYRKMIKKLRSKNQVAEDYLEEDADLWSRHDFLEFMNEHYPKVIKRKKQLLRKFRKFKV